MKLTEVGHKELAIKMQPETFWLAWGNASQDMEGVLEDPSDTTLEDEVGRTMQTYSGYVEPQVGGTIVIGGQEWTKTASDGDTPSKYLYLKFYFDQSHNTTDEIKQLGLYINFTPDATPDAFGFIDTSLVENSTDKNSGDLFENMNIPTITRDTVTSESYDMIITF